MAVSSFIVNSLEAVEVYDEAGELDGYVLVKVPSWYKGGALYSDAHYDRLVASAPAALTPLRSSRTNAWADAEQVKYVGGEGLRYFPAV